MTLREFNGLDEAIQAQVLWEHGVHVATKDDANYQYLLYQLDSFYVEIWYHIKTEMLHRFKSFSDMSLLDPYLSEIDVQTIMRD